MYKYNFYSGDQKIPEKKIKYDVSKIITLIQEQNLLPGDVVICSSDDNYGIYIHLLANIKFGTVPFFYPKLLSKSNEAWIFSLLNCKTIITIDNKSNASAIDSSYYDPHKIRKTYNPGSVIHVTSATTGRPKLVLRSKEQITNEVKKYLSQLKITEQDIILPLIRLDYAYGFDSALHTSLISGAALVNPEIFLPRNIITLSNKIKSTMIYGTPFIFNKLIQLAGRYKLNNHIRYCIASGGKMQKDLQERFFNTFGIHLIQQYGSSETGSICRSEKGDAYQVVGKPLPGVSINIKKDEKNRPVIYVSSPDTIGSYITDDGVNPLPKYDYETADCGEINEHGKLIIFGRKDDIVIIAGLKVSLGMVQRVVEDYPGILKANVKVVEEGNDIDLWCEYTSETDIDKKVLRDFCRKQLIEYQIPKFFQKVDKITRVEKKTWKNQYIFESIERN